MSLNGWDRARAEVENAGHRVIEETQDRVNDVADVNKVAALFAVAIPEAALKQLHLAFLAELEVLVESDGSHAALMLLMRTVDVEVAEAGHRRDDSAAGHIPGAAPGRTDTSSNRSS